jgi:uncharacterized membrane protein YfcA
MPYWLLIVAAIVMLFGVVKISRTARPSHGTPWGALLIWAVLFGAGLLIWFMSARIH